MANVFSVNQLMNSVPGVTDTALVLLYGLKVNMKAAGWTVVQSSNGTSFGASDYWTGVPTTGGWWIVLQGPGGRQICFWVNTTFDNWTGKIIYDKAGSFTFSGATATSPGTIPSTAVYLRGSGAAFASWFGGGTKAIRYAQVLCKDASDGSFWVVGSTPATAAGTIYHAFAFMKLTSFDSNDPEPYAVYCGATGPTVNTSTSNGAQTGGGLVFAGESGTTSGYWWGWSRNTTWRSFQPRYDYAAATNGDINPYSSSYNVLSPFGIAKTEAGFREHKGYLTGCRVCAVTGLVIGDTVNEGATMYAYVMLGANGTSAPQGLFFWDGSTAGMLIN